MSWFLGWLALGFLFGVGICCYEVRASCGRGVTRGDLARYLAAATALGPLCWSLFIVVAVVKIWDTASYHLSHRFQAWGSVVMFRGDE